MKYNPNKIERKWQKIWESQKIYQAKDNSKKPKKYIMVEFPYPSGDGLHVGHIRSYAALDALVRQKRMAGYNVLYPMGWDAFGLPTENYALKTGLHPSKITKDNIKNFKKQMKSLGLSFDWSREINTTDPNYYKWTQWIFIQFFKRGLAYLSEMPINWCPKCKIGLANEEVVSGQCERCHTPTERKIKKQWLLKITKYADRLISDLDKVNYVEKIKTQQINWIGRSEGTEIKFKIINHKLQSNLPSDSWRSGQIQKINFNQDIDVFTTRADTLFGVTALVLAPEHPLVEKITAPNQKKEVEKYIRASKKKSEFERTQLEKEKTGVFTGAYCLNPVNNEKAPIWVGDYVVATYGGGAVMVVPAHDKRDYQFAKKYDIEIKEVIAGGDISKKSFIDYGRLVNSGQFNGLSSQEAIKKITSWLSERKLGSKTIKYKLRDWIFSRQHYWGEPIPIFYCRKCWEIKSKISKLKTKEELKLNYNYTIIDGLEYMIIPAPEKDLPIKLPYVKKYEPTETGESPLAKIIKWVETKCPQCGGRARRETDTMPNWAGSSWYFLRYIDPQNKKNLANLKKLKYWLPVDLYNGGMEHTTLHLLYSRFWHKFLYDLKIAPTSEPYQRRYSHGVVLAEDGRKMSKSFGNVINPNAIIKSHGADSLRVYEMFMGPFDQAINWNDKGLHGCSRFLNRVWQLFNNSEKIRKQEQSSAQKIIIEKLHQLIEKVSHDLELMKFNTAIAGFMEFTNFWSEIGQSLSKKEAGFFLQLLSPFAPHIAEELWAGLGYKKSIFLQNWPKHNPKLIEKETILLVIQVNGRVRGKIEASKDISEKEAVESALSDVKIQKWLADKKPNKIIYIPGRLINLVI